VIGPPPKGSLPERAWWTAGPFLRAPWQARFPFRSPGVIRRAQHRRLRAALVHAYQHVPHYRETMQRLGLCPSDFDSVESLAKLPLIERAEVQADPERFTSDAQPLSSYIRVHTGGSENRPLTIFTHPATALMGGAFAERSRAVVRHLVGKRGRYREARILTPIVGGRGIAAEIAARKLTSRSPRMSQIRLSLFDPPEVNLEHLERFRPDVVVSNGSYLAELFRLLHERGRRGYLPAVAVYVADTLPDEARRLISEELGVAVLSEYGAVEAPRIGFECEMHRGHHLNVDLFPVRIVGSDGRNCAEGESGEIVSSNLLSRGTVLLNYRLGDQARRAGRGCPCGRTLPMLSLIECRVGDWIRAPSGSLVHPLVARSLFNSERGVWQAQVVQHSPTRFTMLVVAASECNREALARQAKDKLRERLGEQVAAEVRFVDALPRTPNGKVRGVVCELSRSG
jgi:phenylacetate-CoA ligase